VAAVKAIVVGFAAGLLFGAGLAIARMTDPRVVLAFLDVTGDWNPSLLAVMAGAASTFGLLYQLALRRKAPLVAASLRVPGERPLDRRLFVGTTLFGIGWGLVGLCPGPAITALFGGNASSRLFVLAMLAGIALNTLAPQAAGLGDVPADGKRTDPRALQSAVPYRAHDFRDRRSPPASEVHRSSPVLGR
jgi:uncharacterized membrane protein YedE/YeeE